MTPTQARYLAFIQKYIDQHGFSPAESDIARAMCVMPTSVNQMMKALEKAGFIARTPGAARSIRILLPPELVPKWKRGLYDGPFGEEHRKTLCIRHIEIRGDQSLGDLHKMLFEAFGMEDEAEYEFNIGGHKRFAPESKHFGLPKFQDRRKKFLGRSEPYDGDATTTLINDHGLKLDQVSGYCFDFEHDWYYFLWFTKLEKAIETVQYPRVTRKQGKAPPQYSPGSKPK